MKRGTPKSPKKEKKMELRQAMQKELERLTCGDKQIAAGER